MTNMFGRPDFPITEEVFATPYSPAPGIVIAYPKFGDWVRLYDRHRERGFRRDHDTFEDMRKHHEQDIKRKLDLILQRSTGKAVMAEMKSGPSVMIFPFDFIPTYAWKMETLAVTTTVPGAGSAGTFRGSMLCGKTVDGRHVCVTATGTGASVDIYFTSSRFENDLETADEALLHELVHASRYQKGISFQVPMNGGYKNLEEFLAVLVTNMYRSERTPERLFDYHGKPINSRKFLDSDLTPNPIASIGWLRKQPSLWASLARVQAPFNPVRQIDDAARAEERRVEQLPI